MRHRKHTFKIGKTGAHRKAMIANMLTSLFEHGRIKTTVVKAKELRRWADKMITCAKIGDLHNRRKVISIMRPNMRKEDDSGYPIDKLNVIAKLFDEIAPSYKDRNGGYTRIIRLQNRKGDNAELCFIELVEEEFTPKAKAAAPAKKKAEKAPAEEKPEAEEAPAEENAEAVEAPAEEKVEEKAEEAPAEEKVEEKAEEAPAEENAEAEEAPAEKKNAEAEEEK